MKRPRLTQFLFPFSVFKVSVFLNRLTSGSIGVTALKMFVVDKPAILTVGISRIYNYWKISSSSCLVKFVIEFTNLDILCAVIMVAAEST